MEETREALVQKLLDIYSKEGNYETSVPGVWVHRSERNKVPKPHIYQPMMIFGLQRACQNMFVALGQAKISIFIALLRKVILLIPLALLLPHFMGVTGVYAAEAVSDATAAICCTLLFIWKFPKILGKIKKKEERAAQ